MNSGFTHNDFRHAYDLLAGGRKPPSLWRVACEMVCCHFEASERRGSDSAVLAHLIAAHEGEQIEKSVLKGFFARHRVEVEDLDLCVAEEWQCTALAAELRQMAHDMAALDEGHILELSAAGEAYAPLLVRLVKSAVKFLDIEAPLGIERPVAMREGASVHELLLVPGSMNAPVLAGLKGALADEVEDGHLGISWGGYDHGTLESDVLRDIERYCQATYGCGYMGLTSDGAALEALSWIERRVDKLTALGWTASLACGMPRSCVLRLHKIVGEHVAMRCMELPLVTEGLCTRMARELEASIQSELPRYPALEADWSMMTMMELQAVVDELNAASAAICKAE